MIDNTQSQAAGEGRRVLALVGGAVVFYAGLTLITLLTDWALTPTSSLYFAAWFLGSGLASGFGVELAKRLAPNFNRVGLIALMVAPVAIFAVGVLLAASQFTSQTLLGAIVALVGTAVGLSRTFGDLTKSR